MMENNRNLIYFLLILLIIILLGVFFFYGNKSLDNNGDIFCTEEAKLCPDGSYVSRNPKLNCEFDPCTDNNENNNSEGEPHFCTRSEREAEICAEIYQPVCGFSDPEKIQCIKYPCADEYSNPCFACKNENVLYWTEGNCPE